MNIFYIAYTASGAISQYGNFPEEVMAIQIATGLAFMQDDGTSRPDVHYVVGGVVTARPACPVSGGIVARVITLTGLPNGCTVVVGGAAAQSIVADASGGMAITVPVAGDYTVDVDVFPALPYSAMFTAT